MEANWGELGDAAPESVTGQGMKVVEVDDAVTWYVVVRGSQFKFGHQAPAGSRQSCHNDRADPVCDRISG